MLKATHLSGFGAGGLASRPTLQSTDVWNVPSSGAGGAVQTYTGMNIGPASLFRFVVLCIGGEATTVRSINSISVNGGAIAGFKYFGQTQGGTQRAEIWGAWVPTGTTMNVAITWSGTGMAVQVAALAFRDWKSASAAFSAQANSALASQDNLVDVPPNGVAISMRQQNGGGHTHAWTNSVEIIEVEPAAGSQIMSVAVRDAGPNGDSGLTINSTSSAATDSAMITVCFFGDGPPVEYGDAAINLAGNTADLAANVARTFAGAATIDFDERALIAIWVRGNAGTMTSSIVTVGGQACTQLAVRQNDLNGNCRVEWWLGPVGATGDVLHTVNGATLRGGVAVYPIRAASLRSDVPVHVASDDTRILSVSNVPYKSGGMVLGASIHNDTTAVTWAGLGEDTDGAMESTNRVSTASGPWWAQDGVIPTVSATGGSVNSDLIDTMLLISLR